MKINLLDFSDGGQYISKGSGDKVRARKIYEELYAKTGAATWKITDVTPARTVSIGHTNKVIGFWHAFAESKVSGAKIDVCARWSRSYGTAATASLQLPAATPRCRGRTAS